MKTLLLSFVLAFGFKSSAQTYDLLPDSCTFCMFTYTDGSGNIVTSHYDIILDQTTVISGQTYVDFNSGTGSINGVRQDGNQLIGYDPNSQSDVLVMDWDSNVGDTIFNLFSVGTNYNAVVTNKDSVVMIGGGYHHFINLVGYEYLDNGNWIAQNWDITWNERGLCGENHQGWNPGGGIEFNMPESWFQGISGTYYSPRTCTTDPRYPDPYHAICPDCVPQWTNTSIEETTYGIKVFPNPASSELNIDLNNSGFTSANIKLKNLLGKVVVNSQLQSNINSIGIEHLTSGVYFISIETITEVILQERIVIQ